MDGFITSFGEKDDKILFRVKKLLISDVRRQEYAYISCQDVLERDFIIKKFRWMNYFNKKVGLHTLFAMNPNQNREISQLVGLQISRGYFELKKELKYKYSGNICTSIINN